MLTKFSLFHVFLFNLVSLFLSKCHDKTLKKKLFISIKHYLIIGRDMFETGCKKNFKRKFRLVDSVVSYRGQCTGPNNNAKMKVRTLVPHLKQNPCYENVIVAVTRTSSMKSFCESKLPRFTIQLAHQMAYG